MPVTLNFCFIISPRDFCLLPRSCGALYAPHRRCSANSKARRRISGGTALPILERKTAVMTPLGRGIFIIDQDGRFVKRRAGFLWGGRRELFRGDPSSRRAPGHCPGAAWGGKPGESRQGNSCRSTTCPPER